MAYEITELRSGARENYFAPHLLRHQISGGSPADPWIVNRGELAPVSVAAVFYFDRKTERRIWRIEKCSSLKLL
jgi:hypothetical protein